MEDAQRSLDALRADVAAGAPLLDPEMLSQHEARVETAKGLSEEEAAAFVGREPADSPLRSGRAIEFSGPTDLEQAGAFGPLEPQLIPGTGYAVLATVDESGAPVVRDLLAEARLKDEADREAVLKQASDMHRHLTGSEGLTVRREPPEVGHPPRFSLLHVKVGEGGQASVKVLVPVAPWHLVEDAIRRFLRETLTPREYR